MTMTTVPTGGRVIAPNIALVARLRRADRLAILNPVDARIRKDIHGHQISRECHDEADDMTQVTACGNPVPV